MKRFLVIMSFVVTIACHGFCSDLSQTADSLYLKSDFKGALTHYLKSAETEGVSSDLYYNIGDTYYRIGNIPQAIIYFERALRLDPTNSDARTNLEFLNTKTIDNPGETSSFWETVSDSFTLSVSPNGWAWITSCTFFCFMTCAFLYIFATKILVKKIGFFGGIFTFLCFILFLLTSFHARALSLRSDEAVVTAKSTILSTSPRAPMNRSEEAMLLHEGIKLRIIDSVSVKNDSNIVVWYDVKIDNDHRAWVSGKDIEKI